MSVEDGPFRLEWDGDEIAAILEASSFEGAQVGAEFLLEVSSELAPHEEGELERSGEVSSDETTGEVVVSFDRPYAVAQHENLDWKHEEGRQAKYLETPMHDQTVQATMLAMMAKRAGKPLE